MDVSSWGELQQALEKKIADGVRASQEGVKSIVKMTIYEEVYSLSGTYTTGQTANSIKSTMVDDSKMKVDHDYGQITPNLPYHASVVTGNDFAGATFIEALHNSGRYPLMNKSLGWASPIPYFDIVASKHRGQIVSILRSNIE